jgi:hypothetical protein
MSNPSPPKPWEKAVGAASAGKFYFNEALSNLTVDDSVDSKNDSHDAICRWTYIINIIHRRSTAFSTGATKYARLDHQSNCCQLLDI